MEHSSQARLRGSACRTSTEFTLREPTGSALQSAIPAGVACRALRAWPTDGAPAGLRYGFGLRYLQTARPTASEASNSRSTHPRRVSPAPASATSSQRRWTALPTSIRSLTISVTKGSGSRRRARESPHRPCYGPNDRYVLQFEVESEAEMRPMSFSLVAIYWLTLSCFAQAPRDCGSSTHAVDHGTSIAWNSGRPVLSRRGAEGAAATKYGPLRLLAIVEDGEIREPRRSSLDKGESLWNVLDTQQEVVLTDIYALNFPVRPGDSYCRFSADADLSNVEPNALFASDRAFRLRRPSDSEQAEFDENIYPITYCANHSGLFLRDVPPEEIPPCEAPKLIGLSDLNENSKPEFWATDILKWSTGIAVWEFGPSGYERIFSGCPGCSD